LFFVHGELGTWRFEAYLVGKLVNVIWGEEWDTNFFGQFNQNVICQGDSLYVQSESKGMKNHPTCHVHVDGASIQLDST